MLHDAEQAGGDTVEYIVYRTDAEARNASLLDKPPPCTPTVPDSGPCGPDHLANPAGFRGEVWCKSPDGVPALCVVRDGTVVIEASSVMAMSNGAEIGDLDRAAQLALAAESHLHAVGG